MFWGLLAFVGGREVALGLGGSISQRHLPQVVFCTVTHLTRWDATSGHVIPAR